MSENEKFYALTGVWLSQEESQLFLSAEDEGTMEPQDIENLKEQTRQNFYGAWPKKREEIVSLIKSFSQNAEPVIIDNNQNQAIFFRTDNEALIEKLHDDPHLMIAEISEDHFKTFPGHSSATDPALGKWSWKTTIANGERIDNGINPPDNR